MARIQTLVVASLLVTCVAVASAQIPPPDNVDLRALQVSEGIVQLFRQLPDSIWPGYNLAERPFVVYRPGKWALLLGYLHDTAGFSAYPPNWPDLGHPVRFHQGQYESLIGQIVFDFPIDDTTTVAVGMPDATPQMRGLEGLSFEEYVFGFVVHEAFHQYQYEAFGEIPWEREERYPILNVENTAMAALEMRLLMDALDAAANEDVERCEDLARMFAAVRKHRWSDQQSFVSRFEQGLEIREGTAKYVEVMALDLVKELGYHSDVPAGPPLPEKMQDAIAVELLRMDFEGRLTDGAVAPDDMPRNRVYSVGAAQGLLLDVYGEDWKEDAQRAGYDFSMVDLLIDRLAVKADSLPGLLRQARAEGGYEEIIQTTARLIESYLEGYRQAFETFEGRPGYRIEIKTKRSGVSRSRVTSQRKWLMDDGRFQLCLGYDAYSLGSDDLVLQVQESGLLEKNDWDSGIRTVTVYVDEDVRLKLDGEPLVLERGSSLAPASKGRTEKTPKPEGEASQAPKPDGESVQKPKSDAGQSLIPDSQGQTSPAPKPDFFYSFEEIELTAGKLFFRCSLPGGITCAQDTIRIDITGE